MAYEFSQAAIALIFYQMVNFIQTQFSRPFFIKSFNPLFSQRPVAYIVQIIGWALPLPAPKSQPEDGMSKQSTDADVAFISALAELLNKNELTELSVKREYGEDDSLEVRVVKQSTVVQMAPAPQMHYAPASAAPVAGATPAAPTAPEDPAQHPGAVTSPMVGTCYLSAEPGAAAFVTVGSTVTEGQTVLIIEAMKTMNHIPAPRAGTVKRILVADGNSVEYGAPLMIIE